jgi:Flp pilus assembly pilin Flp
MHVLARLWMDEQGAAAAEFALVAAILGAAMTFAALAVNGSITQSLDAPTDCVSGSVNTPADC